MSKLTVRVFLSVLISLGVIFAIYTSVQGAAAAVGGTSSSHLVSGAMVNLNHDRLTVSELEMYNAQLELYNNSQNGNGGGCHSEVHDSPDL